MLAPFVLLRLLWLGRSNREYWHGWSERFGFNHIIPTPQPLIWIHAVSVGEVKAASSLVNRLGISYPDHCILVTTVTATGAAITRQIFGEKVLHYYLPYDLPHAISRFIDAIRPEVLIVMETEIWPNLYHYCRNRGISIVLVNARLSERSYRGYTSLAVFFRQVLRNVSVIAAQTEEDGHRFTGIGGDPGRIYVTGNIKFDVTPAHCTSAEGEAIRAWLSSQRPVWIAASTHEGEERLLLEAHKRILGQRPDCLLIIAPRHPERFHRVIGQVSDSGLLVVSRSSAVQVQSEVQVFVLDSMGELPVFYAASDLAFVGGSLLPSGGHNVLEPAMAGIPIVTGTHTENFREITRLLADAGALLRIRDVNELAGQVMRLFADAELRQGMGQAGRKVVEQNRGSVDRVMGLIREHMPVRTAV